MIDCYFFPTPNARRVTLMLELCGLPYRRHVVDLRTGAQRDPAYLAICPTGTVPAIIDPSGPLGTSVTLSQSPAICLYLAEKVGRFLPSAEPERSRTLQLFMHVVTDVTMLVSSLFRLDTEGDGETRTAGLMRQKLRRHLEGLDGQLSRRHYLASELSVADIALYPFLIGTDGAMIGAAAELSNLAHWFSRIAAQPGASRAL